MRVKCLAQERNTMCPARARTWTTRSGDKHTNHEAHSSNISFTDFFLFLFTARLQMGVLCLYVRCTDTITTIIVQFTQPIQVNVHVVAVVL